MVVLSVPTLRSSSMRDVVPAVVTSRPHPWLLGHWMPFHRQASPRSRPFPLGRLVSQAHGGGGHACKKHSDDFLGRYSNGTLRYTGRHPCR